MDGNDKAYIADEINDGIYKFDINDNFITESGQGRLGHPFDTAIYSQSQVYILEETMPRYLCIQRQARPVMPLMGRLTM